MLSLSSSPPLEQVAIARLSEETPEISIPAPEAHTRALSAMWTSLLGLTASVVAALLYSVEFLLVYLFWVLLSRTLLGHLRDLVIVSVVKDPLPLLDVTAGELDELHAQAAQAKGRVELLFDRMVRVAEDTSRAALTRYVLEVGLVELCSVEPLQPVGELIERLELMEERLAGKAPPTGGRGGVPPTGGPDVASVGPGGFAGVGGG